MILSLYDTRSPKHDITPSPGEHNMNTILESQHKKKCCRAGACLRVPDGRITCRFKACAKSHTGGCYITAQVPCLQGREFDGAMILKLMLQWNDDTIADS